MLILAQEEESEMLTAHAYLELVKNRSERNLNLERVYHNLRNPDLFLMAYGRIYANLGATTEGTNPSDTIDGMSIEKIKRIIQSLTDGTFRWQPTRRIYIPKANGKLRPLSIPNWTDKLVQEVIRLILEAYYEPKFSIYSHGFRPNKGCHTALEEIVRHGRGTIWFIEGDIKGCFDNIDHEILLEIIGRNIKDDKFLKLLREMLKVGYMEDWRYNNTYSGTPQGGIISPLLSNIYLNELDRMVIEEILSKYNLGNVRPANPEYRRIATQAYRARKMEDEELAERLGKQQRTIKSLLHTPAYRRLLYVRYADDFILCLIGTKADALEIKEQIRKFLERIQLTLSDEKTLITHASSENARFLGYHLSVTWRNSQWNEVQRNVNGRVALRIPEDVIIKWKNKYQKKGKPIGNPKLLADSDYDIIMRYNSELLGLQNYYQMAINISRLTGVKWSMETSSIMTLANKYKESKTWVYQQYQTLSPTGLKCLEVRVEREDKAPLIARFGGKSIRYERFAKFKDELPKMFNPRVQLVQKLMANECELCGSTTNVEVHHIKSIKSLIQKYRKRGSERPYWVQRMAEMYRKTLVVCAKCHDQIHAGIYDGRKLT